MANNPLDDVRANYCDKQRAYVAKRQAISNAVVGYYTFKHGKGHVK